MAGYVHVSVILDRSGSMSAIRDDVIAGFNAFISAQQALPGRATLTLVEFDSVAPCEVLQRFTPVGEVPPLTRSTFVPRGATPLLDALGRTILDIESTLASRAPADPPDAVVVAMITDGMESASQEFTLDDVHWLVTQKQSQAGWRFIFQSADRSAIDLACAAGIRRADTAYFGADARGVGNAFAALSATVEAVRAVAHAAHQAPVPAAAAAPSAREPARCPLRKGVDRMVRDLRRPLASMTLMDRLSQCFRFIS